MRRRLPACGRLSAIIPLLLILMSLCMSAFADDLSEMGSRTNLQVALWDTGDEQRKAALQELAFSFQRANPDVIVCLEWKDAQLQDDWTRRWCGGMRQYAPDVTVMTERRAWENRHELLALPGDLGRQLRRDYVPAVMDRLPVQARGVPWEVSTYALYYRPDLLEEAEMSVPRTLEALVDCAEAVADPPAVYGLGVPAPMGGGEELLEALARAAGEVSAAAADGEAGGGGEGSAGTEADYAAGLEMLVDLQSRGALQPETLTWTESELIELFGEGRLAMVIAPMSAARTLRGLEDPPEWANAPLPVATGGSGHLSVRWLVGFGDSDRDEEAIRLLRYMAEVESQRMLAMLPSVPAMRVIAEELGDTSPWQAHVAALDGAKGVSQASWERLKPQLGQALMYAMSGRLTPREALSQAREATQ